MELPVQLCRAGGPIPSPSGQVLRAGECAGEHACALYGAVHRVSRGVARPPAELIASSPIDGLNKPYGKIAMRYYREMFNSLSAKQCGVEIDWDRM